ncbi:MAG: GNAT family N-acetyltransferase [Cyclobacteriaceae bacterium]|nr:GNAT family N-acetyltransferase [Cyclobacteriaceae bacterium]
MYARKLKVEEHRIFFNLAISEGSLFASEEWVSNYKSKVQLIGLFKVKSNQFVGGFCVYAEKKIGIPYLRNIPFTPHISLFYKNNSKNPVNINSLRKKVIRAVAEFIKRNQWSIINISLPPAEKDIQPIIWNNLGVRIRYTYQISLKDCDQILYSNFSPERRNDLTKAAKDGVFTKIAHDYHEIEMLIKKTFKHNNLRTYPDILERILFEFATSSNSFGVVSYYKDRPSAFTFIVYTHKVAYYILGGYDRENSHHGAGALCIWESIKEMKSRGVGIFDFEGSMVPAIENFFRGFGGEIVPFYQIRSIPILSKLTL